MSWQLLNWGFYALLFAAGAMGSWLIARRLPAMLERNRFFDQKSLPEKRLTAGGIAIAVPFLSAVAVAALFNPLAFNANQMPLAGLFFSLLMILALGLYDDKMGASPFLKIGVQVLAAGLLVASGQQLDLITNPFAATEVKHTFIGGWGNILLILWIVALTNALNLIDGIDGLASGIALISAVTLFVIAHLFTELTLASLAVLLAGSLFGFIRLNLPPAKVFLGDTGSLFLGFALAAISVMDRRKGSATLTLLVPMVVLTIPLLDAALAFVRRAARGQNPMRGDREHLHHRLRRLGLTDEQVNHLFYFASIYLSITAGVLAFFPKETAMVVLVLLAIGVFMALQMLRSIERGIK